VPVAILFSARNWPGFISAPVTMSWTQVSKSTTIMPVAIIKQLYNIGNLVDALKV
jgi:hypothetical protein